jgi:hypothetical protein
MDSFDDLSCPVCLKAFKTKRGCTSHLRNADSCSWYRQGKLAELQPLDLEGEGGQVQILDDLEGILGDAGEVLDRGMEVEPESLMDDIGDDDDLFHFIPLSTQTDIGEAGPGPSSTAATAQTTADRLRQRILDDIDDSRVEDVFKGAGLVIQMNENLHERWKKMFESVHDVDGDVRMGGMPEDNTSFHPFASELDWRVANWVIKESIGHKAFDRFLSIPGVCVSFSS